MPMHKNLNALSDRILAVCCMCLYKYLFMTQFWLKINTCGLEEKNVSLFSLTTFFQFPSKMFETRKIEILDNDLEIYLIYL